MKAKTDEKITDSNTRRIDTSQWHDNSPLNTFENKTERTLPNDILAQGRGDYMLQLAVIFRQYGVAYENLTISYSRRKWRMHRVHPTCSRRSTRFYGVWRAYGQRI